MKSRALLAFVLCLTSVRFAAPQKVGCSVDSPERRGEPGCSIIADKPLPTPMPALVLWHIDEFPSLEAAKRSEGPWRLAFSAHGSNWLYSIEADTLQHHGGKHRAI